MAAVVGPLPALLPGSAAGAWSYSRKGEAAGTSLVVAVALTVPTLITHTVIGDIDWAIAGLFALGLVPGVLLGSRTAHLISTARLRHAFGVLLIGFAVWFLARQALVLAT